MRVLIGAALLAVVGCRDTRPSSKPVMMNIVAHEDDDELFMNPDVASFVQAGYGNVTVVLTAGEAEGAERHQWPWSSCHLPSKQGRAWFAAQRRAAMRNAYAKMAGVRSSWTRERWEVGGLAAERDTLDAAPQIRLVFLDLPDAGDMSNPSANACGGTLSCLLTGVGRCAWSPSRRCERDEDCGVGACERGRHTFVPSDTLAERRLYTRDALVRQLAAIVAAYQPALIRLPDPHPYYNNTPHAVCEGTKFASQAWQVQPDNLDHASTAAFAIEALAATPGRYATSYYVGYGIGDYPPNLGAHELRRKQDAFAAYAGEPGGLGDVNVRHDLCEAREIETGCGARTGYLAWQAATYERYPSGSSWLVALADGRLAAFAVQGQNLVAWTEDTPGGTWNGPEPLGGGPIAPHVSTVMLPGGDLVVLVTKLGAIPTIEARTRSHATGVWSGWTSLGNPDDSASCGSSPCADLAQYAQFPPSPDRKQGAWLGDAVGAVDGAGTAFVFVRNSFGRASVRPLAGGAWTPLPDASDWPSYDLLDDLAAATDADGKIHVFGSALRGWIPSWTQTESSTFTPGPAAFPARNPGAVAGPVTAVKDGGGALHLVWHNRGDANVMTMSQRDGGWTDVTDLGNTGTGGTGAIAAVPHGSGVTLVARNGSAGLAMHAGGWTALPGQFPGTPSVALDARGTVVVAAVGVDTHLYVRRESGSWAKAGN